MSSHRFVLENGRFLVQPGRMERVDGQSLRTMFLPKLTRQGKKALLDNRDFVRCQLTHYGIQFEEKDLSGNGTPLLKKALQAGQCDQVPEHIRQLQEQMYTEFLDKCTLAELTNNPDWLIDKHFLTSGAPGRMKTTTVYGMVVGQTGDFFSMDEARNEYRLWKISEAASKIPGLHHKTARGSVTRAIFLGWDAAAVENAASEHVASEPHTSDDSEEVDPDAERDRERDNLHAGYLNALARRKSNTKAMNDDSPVGSYVVDSKYFKKNWGDDAEDLRLDIRKTDTPGVFQANFDFGVFEGIMMICLQKDTLEEYCVEVDLQAEFSEDEMYEEDYDSGGAYSEGRTLASGSKRKAPGTHVAKKPKKHQSGKTQSHKYFLKIRCRETGEGEIQDGTEDGTIEFDKKNMATFVGATVLPCYGRAFTFTGRKISDEPSTSEKDWARYSERRHEYEAARRWR